MGRIIDVLVMLAGITFVVGMGIGYGFFVDVFSAGTFWRFSVGCLMFAGILILMQIRDKK